MRRPLHCAGPCVLGSALLLVGSPGGWSDRQSEARQCDSVGDDIQIHLLGAGRIPHTLLPPFRNLGDGIDYGQRNYDCLGELIADTLALFEQKGGDDAFINIKYMASTWHIQHLHNVMYCMYLTAACLSGVVATGHSGQSGP